MSTKKSVNLALQGGGAHGAFGWGVLDKILEDGRLYIEGISATSAGTMNALVYASGLESSGKKGAREALEYFWRQVSYLGQMSNPLSYLPWMNLPQFKHINENYQKFNYYFHEFVGRVISPYQLNPMGINPLRHLLKSVIDFESIQKCDGVKLFINATNVRTGQTKIFHNNELDADVAMASACLPYMFHAVQIEGETYWDGGYTGNPALFPLFYNTVSKDIVILHINPVEREQIPVTAQAINNRINEISFNASLVNELRAVSFVSKLLKNHWLQTDYQKRYREILVHSIRADEAMRSYSLSSKFNTSWSFLKELRDLGRNVASQWLENNFDQIGKNTTCDLETEYYTRSS